MQRYQMAPLHMRYEKTHSLGMKEFSSEYSNQSGVYKHQMPGTLLFNNETIDQEVLFKKGSPCPQEFIICSDTRGRYKPKI